MLAAATILHSASNSPTPDRTFISLRLLPSMETVELKVEMVAIHEKRLRKCLSKLKGIEKVEVEASTQKVAVTGYVHRNKVLKALRRGGLKAELWSAHNEILINAYASGSCAAFKVNNFIRFF